MRWLAGWCLASSLLIGCTSTQPSSRVLRPADGIVVLLDESVVEIEAWACLEGGWLEQIACSPNTREHEALLVVRARPSDVHAALLLADIEPGTPGGWSYDGDEITLTPPSGDELRILVRYVRDGTPIEEPISAWITDGSGRVTFPNVPWVFAGSMFSENPGWMEPGEHYVADETGSLVGLVTFGDEVVAFRQVLSDQEAVEAPQWQVRSEHVPPVGTRVTLILKASGDAPHTAQSPERPPRRMGSAAHPGDIGP